MLHLETWDGPTKQIQNTPYAMLASCPNVGSCECVEFYRRDALYEHFVYYKCSCGNYRDLFFVYKPIDPEVWKDLYNAARTA